MIQFEMVLGVENKGVLEIFRDRVYNQERTPDKMEKLPSFVDSIFVGVRTEHLVLQTGKKGLELGNIKGNGLRVFTRTAGRLILHLTDSAEVTVQSSLPPVEKTIFRHIQKKDLKP